MPLVITLLGIILVGVSAYYDSKTKMIPHLLIGLMFIYDLINPFLACLVLAGAYLYGVLLFPYNKDVAVIGQGDMLILPTVAILLDGSFVLLSAAVLLPMIISYFSKKTIPAVPYYFISVLSWMVVKMF